MAPKASVRRRAYGLPINIPSGVADLPAGLSLTAFDDLAFRERGYEFIGECKRWSGAVRTNRVTQTIKDRNSAIAIFSNRKPVLAKTLFGLPDVELVNNPLAN